MHCASAAAFLFLKPDSYPVQNIVLFILLFGFAFFAKIFFILLILFFLSTDMQQLPKIGAEILRKEMEWNLKPLSS